METDGLNATKIHCVAVGTLDGEVSLYASNRIDEAVARISRAKLCISHNGIGFDLPVLRRLAGYPDSGGPAELDTFVTASLLFPTATHNHSLREWGEKLGEYKGDFAGPWDTYTDEMGQYCMQDVRTTIALYKYLKSELTSHDWKKSLKLEHDVARIMRRQEETGWFFDKPQAESLLATINAELAEIDDTLAKSVPMRCEQVGTTISTPFTNTGKLAVRAADWMGEDAGLVVGPFTKIKFVFPNLGSRDQLADLLIKEGWVPTEYTPTGKPKVDEDALESLTGQIGSLVSRRFSRLKRKAEIEGWLSKVRPDQRIAARVISMGTPTGRMRHRDVVNVPKAEAGIYLGRECRSLFTCPSGTKLVGVDAAGIQLRILAHYMGDKNFIDAIVLGKKSDATDVHSLSCIAASLDPFKLYDIDGRSGTGRDIGKTINYALIFRAGDEKMGAVVGKGPDEGRRIKQALFKNMPAYPELLKKIERILRSRKYLTGLDGRKIWIEDDYSALNYLIQAGEAVIMKEVLRLIDNSPVHRLVGVFHDEVQYEVDKRYVDRFVPFAMQKFADAGNTYKLLCPIQGEHKVGTHWGDTH